MEQATRTLTDVIHGDTKDDVDFEMKEGVSALNLTGYTIKLNYLDSFGNILKKFTTDDNTIIITDAINGYFTIPQWDCGLPSGTYTSNLKFISPAGKMKSWVKLIQKVIPGSTQ